MSHFAAVLDANVLYSYPLTSVLSAWRYERIATRGCVRTSRRSSARLGRHRGAPGWARNFGAATVSFPAPNVHPCHAKRDSDCTGINCVKATPICDGAPQSLLDSDGTRSCMNGELEDGARLQR